MKKMTTNKRLINLLPKRVKKEIIFKLPEIKLCEEKNEHRTHCTVC